MNKQKLNLLISDFMVMLFLVGIDQITKYFAADFLQGNNGIILINHVFKLQYLENRGAAFGMMQNQKLFFIFITVIILGIIIYVLWKTPNQKKYKKLHFSLIMISSGALGNMIDRLRLNYVVDFLYFNMIDFPIFNIADVYVTISAIYLIFLICFVYKEHDLDFISIKVRKFREVK